MQQPLRCFIMTVRTTQVCQQILLGIITDYRIRSCNGDPASPSWVRSFSTGILSVSANCVTVTSDIELPRVLPGQERSTGRLLFEPMRTCRHDQLCRTLVIKPFNTLEVVDCLLGKIIARTDAAGCKLAASSGSMPSRPSRSCCRRRLVDLFLILDAPA